MNFTRILEPQFPRIAVARPWLYAHPWPRVVFSSREGRVTSAVMIPRLKLPDLFRALGRAEGVPDCIQPILNLFKFVLIDLDSITEPVLRFYVFPSDVDPDADQTEYLGLYPFVESDNTAYHDSDHMTARRVLECMGFLVDQTQNRVDHYKFYWYDARDGLIHNTRFNSQGVWQEHWTEQRRVPVTDSDLAHFGITGVTPDPDRHIWMERLEPGQDRQYLTILQRRNT